MKFAPDRPYSHPEKAARKLLEIANTAEAVQDGRIYIELINAPFLFREPTAAEYSAGLKLAIERGWLVLHDNGTCVKVHAGGRGPVRLISRIFRGLDYLGRMLKSAFDPCIPTRATAVPDRPEWIHAIKHDGYRLIVQREGNRVRLWTRNGHDWSDRFPLITEAALRNRNSSFVIDGEAVLLGVDGLSDFDGLHSRKHDDEVQFYAFDCLVSDGEDLRRLPLSMRKTNLARLLARRIDGIFLSDFETGEIGPDLFRHACLMGLEGLVSKHRESTYRSGQFRHWVKVKNRAHPAFARVMDQLG